MLTIKVVWPFLATALLLSSLATVVAQEGAAAKAPPLGECKATDTSDLGTWDDAFVVQDQDYIILQRGDELFSLPMDAVDPASIGGPLVATKPKKLLAAAGLAKTQILAAAAVEKKLWLFMHSPEAFPFAIDVHSGNVAKFEIPGVKIPGEQTPGIGSRVIVSHARAALLMVSGGDQKTWPRDDNRPIYFWMDLESGKVDRLPTGWDLDYFSADESLAVFAKPSEKPFEGRGLTAVEMRTGAVQGSVPDCRKERCVPYEWQEKESIKPLYSRQAKTGSAEHFAGLSYRGRALPLQIDPEGGSYLAMAKAHGDFAAFRLRRVGFTKSTPSPLWFVSLAELDKPRRVAGAATDFALLGEGKLVYLTAGHGHKARSSEAWFHARGGTPAWNVLDGLERLPPLDKKFAGVDYIHDTLKIELIESFGSRERGKLVVCLCTQQRADVRAFRAFDDRLLDTVIWRRDLVLTGDGRRLQTSLFREASRPDLVWLHHSGKIVLGTYVWHGEGDARVRQVELAEAFLAVAAVREVAAKFFSPRVDLPTGSSTI